MSSVVISGDTSGSVTLQAPAVAGTTVLTLPATSGTVITGPGGVVAISGGGTGQTTATAAFDALNPMTTTGDILYESSPSVAARLPIGSTGQVLTVAGGLPSWAAAAGGQLQTALFTAPGTWTNPGSVTKVKVTVVGGGGGGGVGPGSDLGATGGSGGLAIALFTIPTSSVSVTVGSAGNGGPSGNTSGNSGNSSSFGPYLSATGGSGGGTSPGTAGSGAGSISAPIVPGALKQLNMSALTSLDFLTGTSTRARAEGASAATYSYTSPVITGGGGVGSTGVAGSAGGGVSGVVVVEFVG
jgi:hypothetical protein